MSYSDKAVALLDIVGFKNKVDRTKEYPSGIADIANALSRAKEWLDHFKGDAKDIHIQTFSDTTLICASGPTPFQLVSLIWGIALYQCSMVLNGDVLRGAVAVGQNYQKGTTMFGPGIIEAYEAEQVADWPRVVVVLSVLKRVNPLASDWTTRPCILTDDRGLAYVDYLMYGSRQMTAKQWKEEYTSKVAKPRAVMEVLVEGHREIILSLRKEAKGSMRKLTSCHSLAAYHNATIVRLNKVLAGWQEEDALSRPGMTPLGTVFPPGIGQSSTSVDQAATDFASTKLREAPALQDALNGLVIHLPSTFPALYGS